jgi:hypothetical protein
MGYLIELSFNILKNGSFSLLLNKIRDYAETCFCDDCYEDYDFENKTQFQRRHCIITIHFSREKINNIIDFLTNIKNLKYKIYVEFIYDDNNNSILYASQYFITQKMDKYTAKKFKLEKYDRKYSNDECMILKSI